MADREARRERWLHARISENLDEALKREARRRRSPVSLIVRHALETALELVEDLVEDGMEIARRSQGLARKGSAPTLDDVYAWQDVILNRPATCAACETPLAAGTSAYRGLHDQPAGPAVFLCKQCVARLRRDGHSNHQHRQEEKP